MRRTLRAAAAVLAAATAAGPGVAPAGDPATHPPGRWEAPEADRGVTSPVPASAASIERGRGLYLKNCLSCHGEKGDGHGPVAVRLGFSAGDLTDPRGLADETDGSLFWKIATGRDPMPAFKKDSGLADAEIWDVVSFIRTLARPAAATDPGK